jgi:HD-GYP domain-containing protein (c-di-GMP phosphodiesterase class II)
MIIRMDKLIKAIATGLDIVEGELLGASTHHGKRIATLSAAMGRRLGMNDDMVWALTTCALLHDNALTEYILSERQGGRRGWAMKLHCELGQRNVNTLQLRADVSDFILYHHENVDGSGPYKKKAGEFPLGAELIRIADSVDVVNHLQKVSLDQLSSIRGFVQGKIGAYYSDRAADAFLNVLDEAMLFSLRDERIVETANRFIPPWTVDIEDTLILNLSSFITRIIDYKSIFTRRHSTQIANKAWFMGGYYGYDKALRTEFYLAAAFHDIGKLSTPVEILEKPGKLTDEEFRIIQDHVYKTYEFLKDIEGFERICDWASNHHERLDGSGYSFGKKADALDFNSRLMACIDIYQAVCEERPYHPARDHVNTMKILYEMADRGFVDAGIVRDMDKALAEYSGKDIPSPIEAKHRG